MKVIIKIFCYYLVPFFLISCSDNHRNPTREAINKLQLKKGNIIVCGAPDKEFGDVDFQITGTLQQKSDFNTAVELLHSFEYDEAEKTFAKILDEHPDCTMAFWGVAMCNYHPLWEPPSDAELKKGSEAIAIAKSIKQQTKKEVAYLDAVSEYYLNWQNTNPHNRSIHFENAMEKLYSQYPNDKEAAIFYALSLDASAESTDKTFTNQLKAGHILDSLYTLYPNHPGIIHYIIHTYDYPGIAQLGLPAAQRYAQVAPASAHALHMPSHIFTRLGLWDESIKLNIRSVDAAKCYAGSTGIKGHWDEELHGLDYLIYAYLQKGDNASAESQLNYLSTIKEVYPENFKEAYTFAASPCRFLLENKKWQDVSKISIQPSTFPWTKFPWQAAIVHFSRLLGAAHTGQLTEADVELSILDSLHKELEQNNDKYKARQVEIQILTGQAWIAHARKSEQDAITLMREAADLEDSTSKHPVTPGEVLPARELYADLLFSLHRYKESLQEYKEVLKKSPNRFNSLFGAGRTAEYLKDANQTNLYYQQLMSIADPKSNRPELSEVRKYTRQIYW